MSNFGCAHHRAFIYRRGGVDRVGELTPLIDVSWNRIRDEVSQAQATVGVEGCCELLADLETVAYELHIHRDDVPVWEGPIVRLRFHGDTVEIFASDILWVAQHTALRVGYNQVNYPVITRMDWLLRSQTFARHGDPWNVVPRLHPVVGPDDPESSKAVNAWSMTIWEDFDLYAEDSGADYTVIGRDIYWWDINYAWAVLPRLEAEHLAESPWIVEYGNELATVVAYTNNNGYAGIAQAPQEVLDHYGYIELIESAWNDAVVGDPGTITPPTPAELARMARTAQRLVSQRYPAPLSVLIPENTGLLPSSPWHINDLIPGAWFDVEVTNPCRSVAETQRLHELRVSENADEGEFVTITAVSAPATRIDVEE